MENATVLNHLILRLLFPSVADDVRHITNMKVNIILTHRNVDTVAAHILPKFARTHNFYLSAVNARNHILPFHKNAKIDLIQISKQLVKLFHSHLSKQHNQKPTLQFFRLPPQIYSFYFSQNRNYTLFHEIGIPAISGTERSYRWHRCLKEIVRRALQSRVLHRKVSVDNARNFWNVAKNNVEG